MRSSLFERCEVWSRAPVECVADSGDGVENLGSVLCGACPREFRPLSSNFGHGESSGNSWLIAGAGDFDPEMESGQECSRVGEVLLGQDWNKVYPRTGAIRLDAEIRVLFRCEHCGAAATEAGH